MYETFVKFWGKLVKAINYNSYIDEESSISTEKTRKIKISHILYTDPIHATEYD